MKFKVIKKRNIEGKCSYSDCPEKATTVVNRRKYCSLHYQIMLKINRMRREMRLKEIKNG